MNRFEFNTGDHKEEEEKVLVGRMEKRFCTAFVKTRVHGSAFLLSFF